MNNDSENIKENTRAESLKRRAIPFFGAAAGIWLLLSAVLCVKFTPEGVPLKSTLAWLGVLGGICLLDLFALAQALAGLFDLMQGDSRDPIFLAIRTSYWGAIKLVCVIILGFLMARARIPTVGLLTGISTLMVVPILGFIFWQVLSGD